MAKQTTPLPLVLAPRAPGVPATHWLYDAVRAEILGGRLRPGSRLPSTRDLAAHYGLSRGTLVSVFARLAGEGYVSGSVGSGTYVSAVLPEAVRRLGAAPPDGAPRRPRRLSPYGRRVTPLPAAGPRPVRAFRANLPAVDLFPRALWARVSARRLRRLGSDLLLDGEPFGYAPLRQAVTDYLTTARGVRCTAEQVAIVSGIQEALDLSARVLLDRGDRVCIENPGYVGAASAFAAAGARLRPVSIDAEGMAVPREGAARLAYVTPAHQFPLGTTMSLSRRLRLLDWARRSGALIFEDDYDGEYRYAGRPVPALQGLDRAGQVLFAGSFSKVLFPSLRLGYLVIPQDLIEVFAVAKSVMNRYAPVLEQAVLCDFIVAGHFGRHVRRMRDVYAERLAVLIESARARLGGLVEIPVIEAGLQTVGWLGAGVDAEAAARAAGARGIEVIPLGRYARGALPRNGLQLGFAALDPPAIRRGVNELAIALENNSGAPLRGRR
jgi:GntR family transcriptional regulator/MocR family aminotransferase